MLMVGQRFVAFVLVLTGNWRKPSHYDQAIALYDHMEHRLLATRFPNDLRSLALYSLAIQTLGCKHRTGAVQRVRLAMPPH
jgi:hypothetical protein